MADETYYRWLVESRDGMVMIERHGTVDVFIGIDVETSEHQAVALGCDGGVLSAADCSTSRAKLLEIITELKR